MAAFLPDPAAERMLRLRLHAAVRVDEDACVFLVRHLADEDVVVARRDVVMRREALVFVEQIAVIRQVSADSHIWHLCQRHRQILNSSVKRVEAYQFV